ncbi:alpha/beta hydrolase family protein [Kribbella amoyensis]|uniref:Alpha/beta hydrolase family protein n=1 Tax=Kribbella amoyensis TaxID=996641 RepID=A0A561BM07_9ACTN|nr:alpha/beta hydrolase [Kribbella amoyensis]TWD79936.1 alpha/beta hydrolase family protein [Kribbella amoyensis]
MTAARLPWIVLPGLGETPEEFSQLATLLPTEDVRVLDPWRTPVTSAPAELLAATGSPAGRIGLIGHSIGGLAALRWALLHPDQVERLILVDTSLTTETGLPWFHPGTRGDQVMRWMLTTAGRFGLPTLAGPAARRLLVRLLSVADRDLLPKATARARYGTASSWLLFWRELTESWVLAREVGKLALTPVVPVVVLVATGGSSRFTAARWLAAQRRLADALGAELRVLADSAHLVHLDRPDAIAAAVTDSATTQPH